MAYVRTDSGLLDAVTAGAEQLAKILRPNFGPNGRNTILTQKNDLPLVVNTGKKILHEFHLENPDQDFGAVLVRDAALKVDRQTGDAPLLQ